jgi:hypothetical protein
MCACAVDDQKIADTHVPADHTTREQAILTDPILPTILQLAAPNALMVVIQSGDRR